MRLDAPLAIDLFCGLGGWTEGLLSEGWRVIGFDIERHVYGEHRYPATLALQDVRTLHGSQFRGASLIVASSPCQEFSYRAMPWKRAKALPPPYLGMELFAQAARIQREASESAGRHIPMVQENVRGAQPWVGKAQWHYGSYYLWGDVRWIEPRVIETIASVVSSPAFVDLMREELDALLAEESAEAGPTRAELERQRAAAHAERERLVSAIGRGVIEEAEAATTLATVRSRIDALSAALERHRFARRGVDARRVTERDRLLALASDFEAQSRVLHGAALRELIRPWLAEAVVDKVKRVVRLAIRPLPIELRELVLTTQPAPGGQDHKAPPLIRRRITLPPSRAWKVRKRA
jgi:hypothetical protein